jgi:hypothetical protein
MKAAATGGRSVPHQDGTCRTAKRPARTGRLRIELTLAGHCCHRRAVKPGRAPPADPGRCITLLGVLERPPGAPIGSPAQNALAGQCCVGRSQQAGDWFDDVVGKVLSVRRLPREVIAVAVRWYLRYGLSYRDAGELLAERASRSIT